MAIDSFHQNAYTEHRTQEKLTERGAHEMSNIAAITRLQSASVAMNGIRLSVRLVAVFAQDSCARLSAFPSY